MTIKVLVTGAAGFIGSHVAQHLHARGQDVVALDDLSGGCLENVPAGVRFVRLDITDHEQIAQLFDAERFDRVFHLAAYAAEGLSHFIRRFNYQNNLVGSVTLINEAVRHDVERFVFTSSIAVYGTNQLPMTEDTTPHPEDPYGIAKYAVELDLAAAHELFGLNYTVFRPHNVYGERQNIGDRYRNVLGIFINQAMQHQPLTVFGDGSQSRAFSYIDDVAPIIASAPDVAASRGGVFNIGADQPYTVLELAQAVAQHFIGAQVEHLPARTEVEHAYASHHRVRRVFGRRRTTSLEDGVARMVAWAKTIGPQEPTQFEGIEVGKALPASWAATSSPNRSPLVNRLPSDRGVG